MSGAAAAAGAGTPAAAAVEEVVRASRARLVAYLASTCGDIAAAEDALSDAVVAALRAWPERGVPERPDSWLVTAARRGLVDAARRRDTARRALPDVARRDDERAAAEPDGPIPDVRLQLLFACTHPAIDGAVRSPLMLQVVLGLDAARVASAFLVPPATMAQRLVRGKRKIAAAGVPFRVPGRDELPARLSAVLDAVYAAYGTGWDDLGGAGAGLAAEATRLARLVVELLPDEPEARGLLALVLHTSARTAARRDDAGEFVPLDRQDVARWDRALVAEAEEHLARAYAARRVGPYQLQAAVQSVHNRRAVTGTTDWAAVAALYDGLVALTPTVGASVARAAAVAEARGAAVGLALLDELPRERVRGYQPYWVVRAHCLRRLGDAGAAAEATAIAVGLTEDPAVRRFLQAR